jgi:hypothetical protein
MQNIVQWIVFVNAKGGSEKAILNANARYLTKSIFKVFASYEVVMPLESSGIFV